MKMVLIITTAAALAAPAAAAAAEWLYEGQCAKAGSGNGEFQLPTGTAVAEDCGAYGSAVPELTLAAENGDIVFNSANPLTPSEAEEGYSYTLYVKNRELTAERINLRVSIDDHIAVFDQLQPGDFEEVNAIELKLEPGKHRLLVEAVKGGVAIQQEVVVDRAGSAEVDLWFFPQPETWPYFEEGVPPEGDAPVLDRGRSIGKVD